MTNKRILIEVPDDLLSDEIMNIWDHQASCFFYTKDYLKITEIDLDDGTATRIPIEDKKKYGKIIFIKRDNPDRFTETTTGRKGSQENFDYKFEGTE